MTFLIYLFKDQIFIPKGSSLIPIIVKEIHASTHEGMENPIAGESQFLLEGTQGNCGAMCERMHSVSVK